MEQGVRAKITALIVDRNPWFILSLILGLALALRLVFFTGIGSADDVSIANNAIRILEGRFRVPTGHYSARVGMTFPLAGLYTLFGTGQWQTALIPMFSSLGGIMLAFLIGRRVAGDEVGLFAAGALALFPLDVEKSSLFIPDLYFGTLLALAVYLAFIATEKKVGWPWALAAGLVWGGSYLVKVEAAFLLFPIVFLYLVSSPGGISRNWPLALISCLASASVVLAENLAYFSQNGELLFRFKLVGAISGQTSSAFGGGQLWVFPKAWFVTFYSFGAHYYLLFAGLAYAFYKKEKALYLPAVWVIAFLLWLEFGFNPMSENWSFKSHLQRYCLMISVPMAIIVGWVIVQSKALLRPWLARSGLSLVVFISLFFITFNQLGSEKERASKLAIDLAKSNEWFPAYVDKSTYEMALFLLYGTPYRDQVYLFQEHDFSTGETRVLMPEEMDGYLLINRDFVEYKKNRYFMDSINVSALRSAYNVVGQIDNPSSMASYGEMRLLRWAAGFVPVPAIRKKIVKTADAVLQDEDVLIFDLRQASKDRVEETE